MTWQKYTWHPWWKVVLSCTICAQVSVIYWAHLSCTISVQLQRDRLPFQLVMLSSKLDPNWEIPSDMVVDTLVGFPNISLSTPHFDGVLAIHYTTKRSKNDRRVHHTLGTLRIRLSCNELNQIYLENWGVLLIFFFWLWIYPLLPYH